jgi:hypothetical protein
VPWREGLAGVVYERECKVLKSNWTSRIFDKTAKTLMLSFVVVKLVHFNG